MHETINNEWKYGGLRSLALGRFLSESYQGLKPGCVLRESLLGFRNRQPQHVPTYQHPYSEDSWVEPGSWICVSLTVMKIRDIFETAVTVRKKASKPCMLPVPDKRQSSLTHFIPSGMPQLLAFPGLLLFWTFSSAHPRDSQCPICCRDAGHKKPVTPSSQRSRTFSVCIVCFVLGFRRILFVLRELLGRVRH